MSESSDNRRKRYVDYSKGKSKPTCIILGPGHSSDKYKVLGDFVSNYANIRHTNNRGHMDETCGFGLTLRMIYISFPAVVRTFTHLGVSI